MFDQPSRRSQEFKLTALEDWRLANPATYESVWRQIRAAYERAGSRRRMLDALFHLHDHEVKIQWSNGARFVLPDLIELFPDIDNRWLSTYLTPDASGLLPQKKVYRLDRVRVLHVFSQLPEG